jgi:hypothetical protein
MRTFVVGNIEDKIIFVDLPEVKDPIVKGLDNNSEFFGYFLTEWASVSDVKDLLEYLYIVKEKDESHEEYQDVIENGIYNDINASLWFAEDGVKVRFNQQETEKISLDSVISIVEDWKVYLELRKKRGVIYYGGKFFFSPPLV